MEKDEFGNFEAEVMDMECAIAEQEAKETAVKKESKPAPKKKKSTKTTAKKAVEKEVKAIAKEVAVIAEVAAEARKSVVANKPNDDRVTCVVCGRSVPRTMATKIGENEWVCSSRCLTRFGNTRREHSHF